MSIRPIVKIPDPKKLISVVNPWVHGADGMTFKRIGVKVNDCDEAEYISFTINRWLQEGKINLILNLTTEEQFLLDL